MGKRTQYQQHDVAQLVLTVAAQGDSTLHIIEQKDQFPKVSANVCTLHTVEQMVLNFVIEAHNFAKLTTFCVY